MDSNNFDQNFTSQLLRDLENNRRDELFAQQIRMRQQQQQQIQAMMRSVQPMGAFHSPVFLQGQYGNIVNYQRMMPQTQFGSMPVTLTGPAPAELPNPTPFTRTGGVTLPFPYILFRALNEERYPNIMRWSSEGDAFMVDSKNPNIADVLGHYFKESSISQFMIELVEYGWRENKKGFMYRANFHKNMTAQDFTAIIQYKNMSPPEKRAMHQVWNSASEEKQESTAEKASAASSHKNKDESTKTKAKRKAIAREPKTSKSTVKRKAAPVPENPAVAKKKRKPPKEAAKKQPRSDDKAKVLRKQLREYNKLYELFWQWDMWNFPSGLNTALENRKITSYVVLEDKTVKSCFAKTRKTISEVNACNNNKADYAHLLCDEDLPESVLEGKNEEEALAELVERIRKDKEKKDKLKEVWSNMVIPVVQGKFLSPSKFAKSSNEWKNAKIGDRIRICWGDDTLCYIATIRKQQEETSYFQLSYDEDGAEEWVDLSRETFKILAPEPLVRTPPRRVSRNNLREVTGDTPRRDNRARSIEDNREKPIQLPDNYSHLSPFVRYSWKLLGLGSDAGTPAYNSYIREKDATATSATGLDILNELVSLRLKGFSGIPLEVDEDENDTSDEKLTNQLRNLQEKISIDKDAASSIQEFDRALAAVRKLTDKWNIPTVRENLKTIETQVLKLNEQEARILEKCKEKGIC